MYCKSYCLLLPDPTQFTATFDQEEYQSVININSPSGTDLFAAFLIINSSVTISHLSFDIVDIMVVGESMKGESVAGESVEGESVSNSITS